MNPNFGHRNPIDDYNGYVPHGEDPSGRVENVPSEKTTGDNLNPPYYEGPTEQSLNLDAYSNSNDGSAPGIHVKEIVENRAWENSMQEQAVPEKSHDTAAIDVTKLTRDELARSIGNSREIAYYNAKEELEALKRDNELLLKNLEGTKAELSAAMDKVAKNLERINWLESYLKKLSTEQDELSPTFGLRRPGTTTSETKVLENNSQSATKTLEKNSREGFDSLEPKEYEYTDVEGYSTNPGMERRSKYEEGLPEEYSSFSGPKGESNNTSSEDYSENIA